MTRPHERVHRYTIDVRWTGSLGAGTAGYTSYARSHEIHATGKAAAIAGSSDPAFRGDPSRYNPEELLVASLSACHMLTYLHLCSDAGVVVMAYEDRARGTMLEQIGPAVADDLPQGNGRFERVVLAPVVTIGSGTDADASARQDMALRLHADAHALCFIARSVNFPVLCEPVVRVAGAD